MLAHLSIGRYRTRSLIGSRFPFRLAFVSSRVLVGGFKCAYVRELFAQHPRRDSPGGPIEPIYLSNRTALHRRVYVI